MSKESEAYAKKVDLDRTIKELNKNFIDFLLVNEDSCQINVKLKDLGRTVVFYAHTGTIVGFKGKKGLKQFIEICLEHGGRFSDEDIESTKETREKYNLK